MHFFVICRFCLFFSSDHFRCGSMFPPRTSCSQFPPPPNRLPARLSPPQSTIIIRWWSLQLWSNWIFSDIRKNWNTLKINGQTTEIKHSPQFFFIESFSVLLSNLDLFNLFSVSPQLACQLHINERSTLNVSQRSHVERQPKGPCRIFLLLSHFLFQWT